MPRTVKLTSPDARAWRENRAQWVSPDGFVLRAVTAEEETAIFPAVARAKQFKKNGRCAVEAEYRVRDEASGQVRVEKVGMEVLLKVVRTGRDENSFLVETYVGGNKYVKGRDIIRSRILEKHGECILQGTNGKQLTVIRDPRVNRPSFAESQRQAPSPERCHCKGFLDNPDPGRHHIACEWNGKAPPHERALPIEREGQTRGLMDLSTRIGSMAFDAPDSSRTPAVPGAPAYRTIAGRTIEATSPMLQQQGGLAALAVPVVMSGPVGSSVSGPPVYTRPPEPPGVSRAQTPRASVVQHVERLEAPKLVSPKDCENDCRGLKDGSRGWQWPSGRTPEPNQHHPLCKNADAWRAHSTDQVVWMLYDLDRHVELREATPDEVTQSEVELRRSGIRSVKVGEHLFAVVEAGKNPLESTPPVAQRRVRPTPGQDALRSSDGGAVAPPPSIVARPAAARQQPADLSDDEIDAEIERLRALRAARLPSRPGVSPVEAAREAARESLPEALSPAGQYVEGFETIEPLPSTSREPDWGENATVVSEDPSLRDASGLVGLQQKPSDIERGPVLIVPPEEFEDPLERAASVGALGEPSIPSAQPVAAPAE